MCVCVYECVCGMNRELRWTKEIRQDEPGGWGVQVRGHHVKARRRFESASSSVVEANLGAWGLIHMVMRV